nr:MAG TPA: hypothetical protein [Caudoviricetes sp.]
MIYVSVSTTYVTSIQQPLSFSMSVVGLYE